MVRAAPILSRLLDYVVKKVATLKRGPAELVFSLALVAFFATAVYLARQWTWNVKLFPLAVGYPMLAIAIVNLGLTFRTYLKEGRGVREERESIAKGEDSEGEGAGQSGLSEAKNHRSTYEAMKSDDLPPEVMARRAAGIVVWMLGSFAIIWIIGLKFGIPFWMFLFLKFQSKEKLWVAALLALVGFGFMVGFFDRVVHIPWPYSQLTHWFGWEATFLDWKGFFVQYP